MRQPLAPAFAALAERTAAEFRADQRQAIPTVTAAEHLVTLFNAAAETRAGVCIWERDSKLAHEHLIAWAQSRRLPVEVRQLDLDVPFTVFEVYPSGPYGQAIAVYVRRAQ